MSKLLTWLHSVRVVVLSALLRLLIAAGTGFKSSISPVEREVTPAVGWRIAEHTAYRRVFSAPVRGARVRLWGLSATTRTVVVGHGPRWRGSRPSLVAMVDAMPLPMAERWLIDRGYERALAEWVAYFQDLKRVVTAPRLV